MEVNQQLFNAKYYGQKILRTSKDAIATQPNTAAFWNICYDSSYLILRPMSDMTDSEWSIFATYTGFDMPIIKRNPTMLSIEDRHGDDVFEYFNITQEINSYTKVRCEEGIENIYHGVTMGAYQYACRIGVLMGFLYIDNSETKYLRPDMVIENGWAKYQHPELL